MRSTEIALLAAAVTASAIVTVGLIYVVVATILYSVGAAL